jgi:hypothetical protein
MDRSTNEVLLERGKRLIAREGSLNWDWGDLFAEVAPPGGQTDVELMTYLEEVGWFDTGRSLPTAKQLRKVAIAFPPGRRVAHIAFTSHAELAESPDRFEILHPGVKALTKREARIKAGRAPMRDDSDHSARLADILSEASSIQRVKEDPQVAALILGLAAQVERVERDEVARRDDLAGDRDPFLHATGELHAALRSMQRAAQLIPRLSGFQLDEYIASLDDIAEETEVQRGMAGLDVTLDSIGGGAA